ncbi:GntR family transcriptional regulator [Aeromicrobium alkaliterrae]|uniref:GntR family transcriptional regulator n=1 Tax=Aeromicrobium alkaliterrae TaxID=302168 RepID=A0ABN2KFF4_9ACTN
MSSEAIVKQRTDKRSPAGSAGGAVDFAVRGIHQLVKDLTLLPGQPVRQEHVASTLSLSRAPIREALRILHSNGILDYEANVGYTVRRLTSIEFEQVYLMRRALEDTLMESLPSFTKAEIRRLRGLNKQMSIAGQNSDIVKMRDLNEEWHFLIFKKSPHHLIVAEVERIWGVTHSYRSFYLYDPGSRGRVVLEHETILDALEAGDNQAAMIAMEHHRGGVPAKMEEMYAKLPLLGSQRPR